MSDIEKITRLLSDDVMEKRTAAVIVLGELRPRGDAVPSALAKLLDGEVPGLVRHALDALAKVGARKSLGAIFPLLLASNADVRRAAASAVVSVGEAAVPLIRERLEGAAPDERRALDGILAELGGKDAFTTLLTALASSDAEAAKASAIAVRQRVKSATPEERQGYLAEVLKFLGVQAKANGLGAAGTAAAIKILGYLEDPKALPVLLEHTGPKTPPIIRHEALIALRFALAETKQSPEAVSALLDAAADPDRAVAQTALHTLGGLELASSDTKKLEKLLAHPDVERARAVIEQLGRQAGAGPAKVLVKLLTEGDRRRAELAATALTGHEEGATLLGKALLVQTDPERAGLMRKVLQPVAKKLGSALKKQLLETALQRLEAGERGWEALYDVAKDADPDHTAKDVRALAARLKAAGNLTKGLAVLTLLCKSDRATDEDRLARAVLELLRSARDTRAAVRKTDEALVQLEALVDRGFDVGKALRADEEIGLEHLYYAGFHFVEEGQALGAELLEEVVKRGGRAKVARMAKNKLALSEGNESVGDDDDDA